MATFAKPSGGGGGGGGGGSSGSAMEVVVPAEPSIVIPPTTEEVGVELVPINQVGAGIQTIESLWHYCSNNIQTALQNIQKTGNEILETDPEEIHTRMATIKRQLQAFPLSPEFRRIIEDVDMTPTQFYQTFLANISAESFGKKSMRGLFERLGAAKQCDYAARYCGRPPPFWNICYICGGGRIRDSGYECEHIVAAFTAIGHHGLIQSAIQLSERDIEFYYYEYANAHVCCNQIKSDIKWIVYNSTTGSYVIDKMALEDTLTKIWKSKKYDCGKRKALPGQKISLPQFKSERAGYIKSNFLIPLLTKINNSKNSKGETYHLLVRARQLNALNLTFTDIARALLGGDPPERAPPKIQELVFTTLETIQIHYLNQFNRDMGSIFVEILMTIVGVVESANTRLELIKRVLEVDVRISARHPEATIKQHVEDPNRRTSGILKEIRDTLITQSMATLEIGERGIYETTLNINIANMLTKFREMNYGFIKDRVTTLARTLGIDPRIFDQCTLNAKRQTIVSVQGGGKKAKRHLRMIGGGLVADPALFAATPLGFNNPFAYDDGQGSDDRTAGERANAASVAAPLEVMVVYKGTVKPIDEVHVTRSGRIVKPIVQYDYNFVTKMHTVDYKGVEYLVVFDDVDGIRAIDKITGETKFDIFGDLKNPGTWKVEDSEGHRYSIRIHARRTQGGRRIRRTIRNHRKRRTQRKR